MTTIEALKIILARMIDVFSQTQKQGDKMLTQKCYDQGCIDTYNNVLKILIELEK